jgi:hypothetical protein
MDMRIIFCKAGSRVGRNEMKRGGHRMGEKELLDEIFELALQNDTNYLG